LVRDEFNDPTSLLDPAGLEPIRQIWICSASEKWSAIGLAWHFGWANNYWPFPFLGYQLFESPQHTVCKNKTDGLSEVIIKMADRKLILDQGSNRKIGFLEFACHGWEFRGLIPEHDLYTPTETLQHLVQQFNNQKRPILTNLGEFMAELRQALRNARRIQFLLGVLRGELADDAEVRIMSCGQATKDRHDFLLRLSKLLGARVCANDGDVIGIGLGKWWITDNKGTTIGLDPRSRINPR